MTDKSAAPRGAERVLDWAAQLVRIVCGASLARNIEEEVAEPVRRIALQMRDAAYEWRSGDALQAAPASPERVVPPTTAGGNETVVRDGIYMSRKPFNELRARMSPDAQMRAAERTKQMLDAIDQRSADTATAAAPASPPLKELATRLSQHGETLKKGRRPFWDWETINLLNEAAAALRAAPGATTEHGMRSRCEKCGVATPWDPPQDGLHQGCGGRVTLIAESTPAPLPSSQEKAMKDLNIDTLVRQLLAQADREGVTRSELAAQIEAALRAAGFMARVYV